MQLIGKMKKIGQLWNNYFRKLFVIPAIRRKAISENNSFLCNNCTGAMMIHDMGKRFDSPTVNLWMSPPHFLYLIKNIQSLANCEIVDITPPDSNYPIGLLGECKLHFLHYRTFAEAEHAWKKRIKRLKFDNMKLVFVEMGECHKELLEFDRLPFKNKVAFVRTDVDDIKCAYKIDYPQSREKFLITEYSNYLGERYYDQFDFVSFFNND